MDINATLLGQMITFAIFVWFVFKFAWPPLYKALEARKKKIADGLEAAEEGKRNLKLSEIRTKQQLEQTNAQAKEMINQTNQQGHYIIDQAKKEAAEAGQRKVQITEKEITQKYRELTEQLQKETVQLTITCTEKLLREKIDAKMNEQLINQIISEEIK